MTYDYLIVGSGLFGSVIAHEAKKSGSSVLVLEKRPHIGGNIYTEDVNGIAVHRYGAHIFHTNSKAIWDYVTDLTPFHNYVHTVTADYRGVRYPLPFNMNTFHKMWGVTTPEEALAIIDSQRSSVTGEPQNLEEQAISLVGTDIYQKLVKGYTEKQWGRDCKDLPAFIIRRLPFRLTYDNNYFNAAYQGIPTRGYTALIEALLDGIEVKLNSDYLTDRPHWNAVAKHIIFTGPIDAFYDYCYGPLAYRSVYFENEDLPIADFQGTAVVNYTNRETPWTRILEHKHFQDDSSLSENARRHTVITREFSHEWQLGDEPYYPVNDETNAALYKKYTDLSASKAHFDVPRVTFGGRLGLYRYLDMDTTIEEALKLWERLNQT